MLALESAVRAHDRPLPSPGPWYNLTVSPPIHITTGGQFYMGEVVGYKPADDVFQVIYDDEASRIARAQGLAPEVRCLPWRFCC